jgi:hypothetical protein
MSGLKSERRVPRYQLEVVQQAFAEDQFRVTTRVLTYLASVRWSRSTVQSCVACLARGDFFKSQRHVDRPDAWLDIYRPVYKGERLYVKLTLHENEIEYLVLSFCLDGDQH